MRVLIAASIWLLASSVSAEVLTLSDVRRATQEHVPGILRALADNRSAAEERRAAAGAFDLVFSGDSYNRMAGFWDGRAQTAKLTQPLRAMGSSLYSQYRLSDGSFPIYEDGYFTNTGGQFKLGVLFALLRDRDIDSRRFAETDAEFALRGSELDLMLVRIGLQQEASVAYWRWVAAGQRLTILRRLLQNALDRNDGLESEVRQGARAEIFLTENQQNITRRQALVARAERDLALAANTLAFYWRDENGRMQSPTNAQLPEALSEEPLPDGAVPMQEPGLLDSVLQRHPELALIRNAMARTQARIALRENALKPQLNVSVEMAHGLGAIAEGGASRDSTDTIVGLQFSVPIQRRTAAARLEQERLRLEALEFQSREIADKIEQALSAIDLRLRYAKTLYDLAVQEFAQLETLRRAEGTRFAAGASDFFLVNVREENAANSEIQLLNATLDSVIAQVNFDAATLDMRALELDYLP